MCIVAWYSHIELQIITLKNDEIMNDVLLFIVLLALGVGIYGLFYASIKWFEKI